uniref:HTH psq-type domain-containing protein n=1 Tax=Romanomermis culicivorax TaxID=13658 RepID=A0A915HFS8_ROMCU
MNTASLVNEYSCIVTMPKNIISLETKLKIINDASESSYAELGEKYGLPKATIGTIMRQKDQLLEKAESGDFGKNMKRMRVAAEPEIQDVCCNGYGMFTLKTYRYTAPYCSKKRRISLRNSVSEYTRLMYMDCVDPLGLFTNEDRMSLLIHLHVQRRCPTSAVISESKKIFGATRRTS